MENSFSYITRQDIITFPFPYKLWLVVNLEYCDFLQWNRDGTVILLDLVALEDYLNSTRSIFKIKNSSTFLQHLEDFRFERLNAAPEAEEDLLLQYKNEHFQRHRLDLLAKIRRHNYQLLGQISKDTCNGNESNINKSCDYNEDANIPKHVSDRMLGDLCFMFHGGLSKIKKSRLRLQTLLHFHNEKRILKEKLQASELGLYGKNMRSTAIPEEEQVIELPVDLFENPHDSVLNLGDDFRPEYAGYYGNCSKDQIINFFGEYLPMYEDGSMEVKKIVADNGATSVNNSLQIKCVDLNTTPYFSSDVPAKPNVIISTPIAPNSTYNLNFSSNLEPIYITNENPVTVTQNYGNNDNEFPVAHLNSNTFDDEPDISMEEFIKFKESRGENSSENSQQLTNVDKNACDDYNNTYTQEQEDTKPFPQMPSSVQMEITEDFKENEEANFRNFFSQYRASLNLLYDRQ